MSKKAFLRALQFVRVGNVDRAVQELAKVDRGFIRRRMTHYMSQPDHREAALQLQAALAPPKSKKPLIQAPPRAPFAAPLPPANVDAAPTGAITFDDPVPFLTWASADWDQLPALRFADLSYTDTWPLVALACLMFPERGRKPPVDLRGDNGPSRFAHAVGLGAVAGGALPELHEPTKSVRLTRIRDRSEIESTADAMASLLISEEENRDVRLTVKYVLIELMRNVIQHSEDSLGAVAAAQLMGPAQRRSRPMIQLAVADAGIGIPRHLQRRHGHLVDYRQALERALLPHISGTFDEGLTGSFENAGLGLYMISELARQTGGRLLIATTGAALVLQQAEAGDVASPRFLEPVGVGFPGTVVAVELPSDSVQGYYEVMQGITRKALQRTPKRTAGRWLEFGDPPADARRVSVGEAKENTVVAMKICTEQITPSVVSKTPIVLDFTGLDLCTQSWLHSLLYEPVRLAWALRVPIYVIGAEPAVREGLRFLESYALGG